MLNRHNAFAHAKAIINKKSPWWSGALALLFFVFFIVFLLHERYFVALL